MNWLRNLSVVSSSPSFMTKREMSRKMGFNILVFCFLFAGCTTTTHRTYGIDFDQTKADAIVKGESSKQDIVQLLGEPYDKSLDATGTEKWTYLYQETTIIRTEDSLARFSYDGSIWEKKLEIVFDQDIVKNFVFSESTTPYTRSAPQSQ